jgi:putative ABC transport system permease protein
VNSVTTDPFVFIKGALLGIGATLLAAIAPALDAAHTPPGSAMRRANLERRTQKRVRIAACLALPCILLAALMLKLSSTDLYTAFGAIFLIIVAGALLMPLVTLRWLHFLARPAGKLFGIAGSLAMRGAAASLSRTGVAIAALSVAVTTVIGMGLMIGSFRTSLDSWLDTTLLADFYVSADDTSYTSADETFSAERLTRISELPGVTGLSLGRYTKIKTPSGELALRALRPGPRGWGIEIIAGDRAEAIAKLAAGSAVLISEPLALRRGPDRTGQIELPTRRGKKVFDVAGVFRDYRTDGGSVLLDLDLYRRHWNDDRLSAVGVYVQEDYDSESMQKALESALSKAFPIQMTVVANKLIRDASLAVFDRTFEITQVLRILAGIVAFLGILSALLALQLERIREAAVLRALGFTPAQITGQTLLQTTILGFTAGLFAIPSGIVLAAMLVHVINERAFGWSMSFSVFPRDLLAGLAIATLAAFLAGIYPARRLARSVIAGGLRNE